MSNFSDRLKGGVVEPRQQRDLKRRADEIKQKQRSLDMSGKSARELAEESRQKRLEENPDADRMQDQTSGNGKPLERLPNETDKQYRRRQEVDKLKRGDIMGAAKQHVDDYANDKKQQAKDYAKRQAKDYVDRNPKVAKAIEKGKKAKEDFENRINAFQESAKEKPLKQQVGESDKAFLERQRAQEGRNSQINGLAGAAKQHVNNYAKNKKQQAINYGKRQINNQIGKHPQLANLSNKAQAAKAKADEIQKRAKAIKEQANLKRRLINERLKKLKNALNIKKRMADKAKQLAAQMAKIVIQALARAAVWLAGAAVSATVGTVGLTTLIIILVIIVIIAVVAQTCDSNWVSEAICNAVSWISSHF